VGLLAYFQKEMPMFQQIISTS